MFVVSAEELPINSNDTTAIVSLIEDDATVRVRLSEIINNSADLSLGFCCDTLEQGMANIQDSLSDVLLLDLGLPDGNGIELIKFIEDRGIRTGVIVITVFGDEKHILDAISAGAVGYLLKDEEHQEIEVSIAQMLKGGSPISPSIARHLLKRFQADKPDAKKKVRYKSRGRMNLTSRELEVLQKISKGFTSKEISEMENISYHTVTTHIRNIYKKLSVNSRTEALFEAYNMGLL